MMHDILTIENPNLAEEWDYEKNGDLHPNQVTGGSGKKVWWKCALGHSWKTQIISRTDGTNCPYCSERRALAGFNDLATKEPLIAAQWDYEKNGDLRPENCTRSSHKDAWWKCVLGHSWRTSVGNRSKGDGCPYCGNRKVLIGFNDLCTTHPHIAKQWDYIKNDGLRPEQFTFGSCKTVWWKCVHGHSWKARISSRQKCGCPSCGRRVLTTGINDLLTQNPKLAKEWDYEKNVDKSLESVTVSCNYKAWWRCEKGHSWQTTVNSRNNQESGCPYCTNQKVLKGYNDLLTVDPVLCSEWHYEKNAPLRPDQVTKNTARKVWWKCAEGHVWKTGIRVRRNGCDCPFCAGKVVIPGKTDLKTLRPEIAAQWDYEKNGTLRPEHVTAQSMIKVWWICDHGHSYSSVICNRYYGNDCPYCANKLPIIGKTDLATVHPEWLEVWDYGKNGSKKPEHFTRKSNKKVWWKCKAGHSWRARIADRHAGTDCPYCYGKTPMQTRLIK